MRQAIKIDMRKRVYKKYNGHCSYCGRKIDYKDMQVDHIVPLNGWSEKGEDTYENFNPSCRRCNHYKRCQSLESFRLSMRTLHERISKDYITKIGIDYGIVTLKPFDGKFYFEKIAEMENKFNHQ